MRLTRDRTVSERSGARHRADQALATRLPDAMGVAVVATDLHGLVLHWNPAAQRMYGWSADEALGRQSAELMLPPGAHPAPVLATIADGVGWSGEFVGRHRDGHRFRVAATTTAVRDHAGRVTALVGVSHRLPEPVADVLLDRLSAIVTSSSEAVVSVDADGSIVTWNPAAEQLLQFSAEEVIGRVVYSMLDAEQARELRRLFGLLAAGHELGGRETLGRRKDGSTFPVDLRLSSIRDREGRLLGFAGTVRDVSGSAGLRDAAEADRRRLTAAQSLVSMGSCELELSTGAVVWSRECWRIADREPDPTASSEDFLAFVHPADVPAMRAVMGALMSGSLPEVLEYRLVRPSGEIRWIRQDYVFLPSPEDPRTALVTKLDITEIRTADADRRSAEARMWRGFESSSIAMVATDLDGQVLAANPAYLALVRRPVNDVVGAPVARFLHPDDAGAALALQARMRAGELDTYVVEHRLTCPEGNTAWVSTMAALMGADAGVQAYVSLQMQDITARREAEAKLAHQAFHDPLTGLPNRQLLGERITRALADAERSGARVAAVFLDVDQFKVVNDGIGHAAGDELLVQVADRLRAIIRPEATLARFGGDEFVVLCPDVTSAGAFEEEIGVRIAGAMSAPFTLAGRDVVVTVSAGVALAEAGTDAGTLLRNADSAMYRAKERGRNRTVRFDDEMHRRAAARLEMELSLRDALRREEFVVHYQPVFALGTRCLVGVEALVRWQHPTRGLLGPAEFIDLAEQTGLVVPIGAWVLRTALGQVAHWRREEPGRSRLGVAVNISARQVAEAGTVALVADAVAEAGLPARAVHLEMTESVVMDEGRGIVDTLEALKSHGVKLAVDDFGTGYSSLAYLKALPVDILKIDRSFVDGLGGSDPDDASIVRAIQSLARAMNLTVVAEGIETPAQLAAVTELGVDYGQGHLWSRAVSAAELTRRWRQSPPPSGGGWGI